ncbi:MAG: signal peptidase II [Cyclobacteriaceae bacterium]
MKTKVLRSLLIVIILTINIGCDQISKGIVRQRIRDFEQISIIKNCVTLTKVENTGAFLSLGNSLPDAIRFILLSLVPLVVLGVGIGFLFAKSKISNVTLLGSAFVIGGGIGNIYDRLVYGSVTDFLHIDFGIFQTGIFNLADVSIMMGLLMVFVNSFKTKTVEDTEAMS